MKKVIVLIFCFILISPPIKANKYDAKNRFKDGPHLIDKGIEYINARSVNTFTVIYNLYIHPGLIKSMEKDKISTDYINTEKKLRTQGRKICRKNPKADFCKVYYWSHLSLIPNVKDTPEPIHYVRARGSYIAEKKTSSAEFQWHNSNDEWMNSIDKAFGTPPSPKNDSTITQPPLEPAK